MTEQKSAVVLFTDIRGFTRWAEKPGALTHAPKIINAFQKELKSRPSSGPIAATLVNPGKEVGEWPTGG